MTVIVLSGPIGAGKSSLTEKYCLKLMISCTKSATYSLS